MNSILRTLLHVLAAAGVLAAVPCFAQRPWTPLKNAHRHTSEWLVDHGLSVPPAFGCGMGSCGCNPCATSACGEMLDCCPRDYSQFYFRGEYLVWWFDGNEVPALVTTGPQVTPRADAGVLGRPGTEVLFGDEAIDDHERFGGRYTLGYWFTHEQVTGIELQYVSIFDGHADGSYFAQSQGNQILARPFFNTSTGLEDAVLVSFTDRTVFPAEDIADGSIRIDTSSELHSANATLRHNLNRQPCRRLDLIGGYRYLRFREDLTINDQIISQEAGGAVPVGTLIDVRDAFSTGNDFHGGELGLMSTWQHRAATLELVSKVAIGNVHQVLAIDGSTTVTPGGGGPATTSSQGLLAQPTNIGTYSQDEFAWLPEFDATLRLAAAKNLQITLGYSLIVLNDVLRTGDAIDRSVNPSQFAQNGGVLIGDARPAPQLEDSSFWAQGVSIGLEYRR